MPGMGFGLGFGFHRRASGSGASASEQLLTLATDDGWKGLYDPTNEDTRTLRNDGANDYLSAIADGLGNLPDLAQATAADQPQLSVGAFGELDAALGAGSEIMQTASFTELIQPNLIVCVARDDGDLNATANRHVYEGITNIRRHSLLFDATPEPETMSILANTELNGPNADANAHVWSCLFNGASSKIWRDGALIVTGDAGLQNLTGFTILAYLTGAAAWVGPATAWAIYDGDPGDTKRTAMEDKLHELTGIAKA